ncbi:MAG: M20/M25/M40 family metallo-hydrolase [Synergistaceae bacterium]|jgi:arginine utilization protein RocB|nr:M20/M25/M40 family metallo-hydrolase [Synergistaceae bacterium]
MPTGDANLKLRIETILKDLTAVYTPTGTAKERDVEAVYREWFKSVPYLASRPSQSGFFPIPNDPFGRTVPWCVIKGRGNETVVLLHHSDVVDTDDYGALRELAVLPDELAAAFASGKMDLGEDASKDMESGEWIFGRGTADMKGGAAVQMAVAEEYARRADMGAMPGNIVLLGLPDEENLSAGGRAAPLVLKELREKFGLDYLYAVNSEPTDRTLGPDKPKIFVSSIGKVLPLIFVRGALAHAGRVYDGFSPARLLAHIVRRLDINPAFIDADGDVVSCPAAFLYMKDCKTAYDVSLPRSAAGVMNVMFLKKSVAEIIGIIRTNCEAAFGEAIEDAQKSFDEYGRAAGREPRTLPWEVSVRLYSEVYKDALRSSGGNFSRAMKALAEDLKKRTDSGEINLVEASRRVVETTLLYTRRQSPEVVIAFAPPYYPVVNNSMLKDKAARAGEVCDAVISEASEAFADVHIKHCLAGMSDFSYFLRNPGEDGAECIKDLMPLWDGIYSIPFDAIAEISMPIINIGPWGKGIHTYRERVWAEDLFVRVPHLLKFAVDKIIG